MTIRFLSRQSNTQNYNNVKTLITNFSLDLSKNTYTKSLEAIPNWNIISRIWNYFTNNLLNNDELCEEIVNTYNSHDTILKEELTKEKTLGLAIANLKTIGKTFNNAECTEIAKELDLFSFGYTNSLSQQTHSAVQRDSKPTNNTSKIIKPRTNSKPNPVQQAIVIEAAPTNTVSQTSSKKTRKRKKSRTNHASNIQQPISTNKKQYALHPNFNAIGLDGIEFKNILKQVQKLTPNDINIKGEAHLQISEKRGYMWVPVVVK